MLPPVEYVVYDDMKSEAQAQITTPTDVIETDDQNQMALKDYWLNEIKSQEDTARQIITICALLIGVSITLITSNFTGIAFMINDTLQKSNQSNDFLYDTFGVPTHYSFLWGLFSIFAMITCWFLIWIDALNIARISLKTHVPEHSCHIPDIAIEKQKNCTNAAITMTGGMIGTALMAVSLLMVESKHSLLGGLTFHLGGLTLMLFIIRDLTTFIKKFLNKLRGT